MCLAAVAQRKMVTICHLSSSSRHLKKVQRAGRQSSSFTVESSGVTRKKSWPLSSMHMAQYGGKSINTYCTHGDHMNMYVEQKQSKRKGKMIGKSIILILQFE